MTKIFVGACSMEKPMKIIQNLGVGNSGKTNWEPMWGQTKTPSWGSHISNFTMVYYLQITK
jgi:hypothetical protein